MFTQLLSRKESKIFVEAIDQNFSEEHGSSTMLAQDLDSSSSTVKIVEFTCQQLDKMSQKFCDSLEQNAEKSSSSIDTADSSNYSSQSSKVEKKVISPKDFLKELSENKIRELKEKIMNEILLDICVMQSMQNLNSISLCEGLMLPINSIPVIHSSIFDRNFFGNAEI